MTGASATMQALLAEDGRRRRRTLAGAALLLAASVRALGDPVRWAIVRELRDGTRCACRLAEVAGVSSTLLSHHAKVLREAGLISGVRRGRWIDYSLEASSIEHLAWCLQPTLAVAS